MQYANNMQVARINAFFATYHLPIPPEETFEVMKCWDTGVENSANFWSAYDPLLVCFRSVRFSVSAQSSNLSFFSVSGLWGFYGSSKLKSGCNAHIVRFVEYQTVKEIDPRGVEIRKLLILRQTNNVCVAPTIHLHINPVLRMEPWFFAIHTHIRWILRMNDNFLHNFKFRKNHTIH